METRSLADAAQAETSVPFSGEQWQSLMASFRGNLFRLEALSEYDSADEKPLIDAFLSGHDGPVEGPYAEFFAAQRALVLSGRTIERVHIVPDQLTPYLQWEILWCYRQLAEAGVKVYLVPESKHPSLAARAGEFYLVDDVNLIEVVYGPKGKFLELRRVTDEKSIIAAQHLRSELIKVAIPFDEFVAGLNSPVK